MFPRVVGAATDIGAYETNAKGVLFADALDERGLRSSRVGAA